jgi:murein DD-endopeptidase MepM/ murein hydrolase activator NlpD
MEERIEELTKQVTSILLNRLGEERSESSTPIRCTINGLIPATYTLNSIRINKNELLLQEIISSAARGSIVYRGWTFRKKEQWYVAGLEKQGKPIFYRNIGADLSDLNRRCDTVSAVEAGEGAYMAEISERASRTLAVTIPGDYEIGRNGIFPKSVRFLTKHSALVAALLIGVGLAAILGIYSLKLGSMEKEMSQTVQAYQEDIDGQVKEFFTSTEDEIGALISNVQKNRKDFEFDQHNAYLNVQRLSEELTKYTPARKKAYHLIAENILQSTTYSEIMYEMSRLPTEEYQARIFLATDRQSVIPLAGFDPIIPEIAYPVQVEGEENDGKGFRITDGYMVRRENPLGTGGTSPHFAVDIINVSNIAYVNHAGEIIREGKPPGKVVAVAPGKVMDRGWDDGYGWYIEVDHRLEGIDPEDYPDAEHWSSYYAHLEERPTLEIGTSLEREELIGHIGNSGRSTGPHLHFEIRLYHPGGNYFNGEKRYDKLNPYPEEKKR